MELELGIIPHPCKFPPSWYGDLERAKQPIPHVRLDAEATICKRLRPELGVDLEIHGCMIYTPKLADPEAKTSDYY
ncbi:hypothetical protein RRF57_012336 [Xylaria bambusicola]|uniref:Uncharacterized protein n=1 Tax=Xylaria bambusicola TaxID=326684 RepID=A0AAN7UXW1_9PEZI